MTDSAIRNLVISLLRLDEATNIAGALRYNAANNRRVLNHLDVSARNPSSGSAVRNDGDGYIGVPS